MATAAQPPMGRSPVQAQAVKEMQAMIAADPKDGWKRTWEQAVTPWDLGTVTPAVAELLARDLLPPGRVLVPGCGSGYDVVAMAGPSRRAVGLDLSELAVQRAQQLAEGKEGAQFAEFVSGDFFSFAADPPFDAIFDHTFFVALEPSMRAAWAETMARLLAPSGQLITLIWPISDHQGGPPYAVTMSTYESVLQPLGFEATVLKPLADSERWGKDMLVSWMRKAGAKI